MNFADKVKMVRYELGLSQEKIAAKLGVSFSTINRWERGHSFPSYTAQLRFEEFCKENNIDLSKLDKGGN